MIQYFLNVPTIFPQCTELGSASYIVWHILKELNLFFFRKVLAHWTWNYNVFNKYWVSKWALAPSENSAPGTQQSVVTELVAIVEEEHLDIGGESRHVMARRVQDELVRSVLGQHCRSKAHPSRCNRQFHPFPQLGDGGDGFLFG